MRKFRYGFRKFGLPLLSLILLASLGSGASASDAVGTAIITLNVPITADGSAGDPYHAYYISAQRKDRSADVHFLWHEGWAVSTPDDLAGSGGHGAVIVKELSAGDWEINTFRLETHGGWRKRWYPVKEFSIPFTIRSGRATYIGSFQPVAYKYKDLLGTLIFGGARFVVADRSTVEIPIAKIKNPSLGPVDVEVFDVDKLNNPLFSNGTGGLAPDETAFAN